MRVESEGPMQELHPGDQTWYISEDGITLEQLPFIDPRTGAPSAKEDFKPAEGRLSYTRSPSEARAQNMPRTGHRARSQPAGQKVHEVFQMGTSMTRSRTSGSFCTSTSCPSRNWTWKRCRVTAWSWKTLHAVLAEAQTRADALDEIVRFGREATENRPKPL